MSRLRNAIDSLNRMTERQRDARATEFRNAVYLEDKRYHKRLLDIYDGFMAVINKHGLEVATEDAEKAKAEAE